MNLHQQRVRHKPLIEQSRCCAWPRGIAGGADVSSGAVLGLGAADLLIGWLVHGSRSTGFFSSGLGIGGGSGVAEGGCTVDGASGIAAFGAGCVCDVCCCALGFGLGAD